MNTTTKTLSALAGLALVTGTASAAVINTTGTLVASIDLGNDPASNTVGEPFNDDGLQIPGETAEPWAIMTVPGGIDSSTTSITVGGITFTWNTNNKNYQSAGVNSPSQEQSESYLRWGPGLTPNGSIAWEISGLDDSYTYDIIFFDGPRTNTTRNAFISVDGVGEVATDADGDSNFLGLSSTGGKITGFAVEKSQIGNLGAIQIAQIVPEPGSLALLGLGGLLIGARRRRD